jgi:hypothetical protein
MVLIAHSTWYHLLVDMRLRGYRVAQWLYSITSTLGLGKELTAEEDGNSLICQCVCRIPWVIKFLFRIIWYHSRSSDLLALMHWHCSVGTVKLLPWHSGSYCFANHHLEWNNTCFPSSDFKQLSCIFDTKYLQRPVTDIPLRRSSTRHLDGLSPSAIGFKLWCQDNQFHHAWLLIG